MLRLFTHSTNEQIFYEEAIMWISEKERSIQITYAEHILMDALERMQTAKLSQDIIFPVFINLTVAVTQNIGMPKEELIKMIGSTWETVAQSKGE